MCLVFTPRIAAAARRRAAARRAGKTNFRRTEVLSEYRSHNMSTGLAGLARVRHEHLNLGGDLRILLSIAEPLSCTALHPKFVLYVLDPEPELFAIATAHMYSRYGYEFTEGNEPFMRHVAIVGVGHDPALYDANAYGFNAAKLRDLRRKHFRDDKGGFLQALGSQIVPQAEALLSISGGITRSERALLGCSLSSLAALRTSLRSYSDAEGAGCAGDVFGALLLGSPSLIFTPELIDEASVAASAPAPSDGRLPVKVLMVVGEMEALPEPVGNGIPAASEAMAARLRAGGHSVECISIVGENHDSLKPSLISRGFTALEEWWSSKYHTL